jgi:2-amino-4-hydroxy-6-hydroxymethyldihydropteridine diphosphokinase
MNHVYLLLGSNMGNRKEMLEQAVQRIADRAGEVVRQSSVYETLPWGFDTDVPFLNQAIRINTEESPMELLEILLEIETDLGRIRFREGYASREIDVDILFFNDRTINDPDLIVPHPRLHLRKFTLVPLVDLDPSIYHPVFRKTVEELLYECEDELEVRLFETA